MQLIIAWVLFPLALAAAGAGWGLLVERATGARVSNALLIPLGLAAVICVAGLLVAFDATARAAVPVAAVGAIAGLAWAWRDLRLERWALLAALGALLAYGAPVLMTGQATFLGYIRLDDTATWLDVMDHMFAHGPSTVHEPASTYSLVYQHDVGPTYPRGAFVLLGVGRALVGVDGAWAFQSYLACCGALLALALYALLEPVLRSSRLRALVAFLAAPAALLYGYSLWGGIKELTGAFLLATGIALIGELLPRAPASPRRVLPAAVGAGALIVTLGVGAAAWIAVGVVVLAAIWLIPWQERQSPREALLDLGALAGATALLSIPLWLVIFSFDTSGLFSSGQTAHTQVGNLYGPLNVFQLAGIWPVGDFRLSAPTFWSTVLIALALLSAGYALWWTIRDRTFGLSLYVAVALAGAGVVYFSGGTPWVTGKAMAIASPALLTAGLAGAGLLWGRHRAFALVLFVLGAGVAYSAAAQYHDALIAPRDRLAELQTIGNRLSAQTGPVFLNEYEIYGTRHFLRAAAPVAPAEYRPVFLPTRSGKLLTDSAWADLDSFPLSTLSPYRSLVVRRTPVESRPPSIYRLTWQGRYYELWQQPARPAETVIEHVPYGDSNQLEYCGVAENAPVEPLCSIRPVDVPSCPQVHQLARTALKDGAVLVAYQRPPPIVLRGDETQWPGQWMHDPAGHGLTPTVPGTAVAHILVASDQRYALWLGGNFARGFDVTLDGHDLGRVANQLSNIGGYVHVGDLRLAPGAHTVTLTYPHAGLGPGSGDNQFTSLSEIVLDPLQSPAATLLTVDPHQAQTLCGRPIDWIEIVRRGG